VVAPGVDYGRLCAEAGRRVTWKHKWRSGAAR
jgi:hypothetical protein